MSLWTFLTTTISGIYFTFLLFAVWFYFFGKLKFSRFHIGLTLSNYSYCILTLYLSLTAFSINKLYLGLPLTMIFGSSAVFFYVLAISHMFSWKNLFVSLMKFNLVITFIIGVLFFLFLNILKQPSFLIYKSDVMSSNLYLANLMGEWQLTFLYKSVLAFGGLTTLSVNVYFFYKMLK